MNLDEEFLRLVEKVKRQDQIDKKDLVRLIELQKYKIGVEVNARLLQGIGNIQEMYKTLGLDELIISLEEREEKNGR